MEDFAHKQIESDEHPTDEKLATSKVSKKPMLAEVKAAKKVETPAEVEAREEAAAAAKTFDAGQVSSALDEMETRMAAALGDVKAASKSSVASAADSVVGMEMASALSARAAAASKKHAALALKQKELAQKAAELEGISTELREAEALDRRQLDSVEAKESAESSKRDELLSKAASMERRAASLRAAATKLAANPGGGAKVRADALAEAPSTNAENLRTLER